MITTSLTEASRYYSINPLFEKAFNWLKNTDVSKLKPGKVEIEGEKLYASIQNYETKDVDVSYFEAHRKYIDIQLLTAGEEIVDYAPFAELKEVEPYSEERDFHKLDGKCEQKVTIKPGNAVILFPEDGHRPCQHPDGKTKTAVSKIVFKVLI